MPRREEKPVTRKTKISERNSAKNFRSNITTTCKDPEDGNREKEEGLSKDFRTEKVWYDQCTHNNWFKQGQTKMEAVY